MIQASLFIAALLLLLVGYYLIRKQTGFLLLIGETPANKSFLTTYGGLYLLLGFVGGFVAFLNTMNISLLYILTLLLISAIFSIKLSKKIAAKSR